MTCSQNLTLFWYWQQPTGAGPESLESEGGDPNSGKRGPKTAFECLFQCFSYKSLNCKILQKRGEKALPAPPLNPWLTYLFSACSSSHYNKIKNRHQLLKCKTYPFKPCTALLLLTTAHSYAINILIQTIHMYCEGAILSLTWSLTHSAVSSIFNCWLSSAGSV